MREKLFQIGEVPALLLGEESDRGWLFVHGQHGCKEEARELAEVVCPKGWQVLSIDLPEHGGRGRETGAFDPWHAVPELRRAMAYARGRWKRTALRATSIGAWFSMLAFGGEPPERSLFVSPVLDMAGLILTMMGWTPRDTAEAFAARFSCDLTILEEGEHWFHTPEQLSFLRRWTEGAVRVLL